MILYRYIIKELIFPFIVSICIISFFFVMQQAVLLAERIISKGIDLGIVLEIFAVQLGWIVVLAVPMGILLGTLWTFGRMSGDNEITSIKASGQNPINLLIPVLAAASVFTILIYFFNDFVLPDANHRTANLLGDIARKKPAALIEPRILIRDYPGYAIYIDDVDPQTGVLKDIRIFTDSHDQDPSTTIADSGLIQMTPDQQYIRLSLFNGETHSIPRNGKNEYFVGRFGKQVVCIKNIDTDLQRTQSSYRGDREKTTSMMYADVADLKMSNLQNYNEFNQTLDSLKNRIRKLDSLSLTDSSLTQKDTDSLTFEMWVAQLGADKKIPILKVRDQANLIDRVTRRLTSNNLMIAQYTVEIHKKYAMPVACIIFALIGAPLGIMARRGGLTVGATYSIIFFIINWICLIGGEALADKGKVNPILAMWFGNILTGIVAVILIIFMLRDRSIRFDAIPLFFKRHFPKIRMPHNKFTSIIFQKIP
ncbi:MAG: YjgP/YjgQ family permease, partial [Fibrobacter sp.]|nr:YjgP/YjgQ family permease [Fibrobacter sp.]